MSTPLHMDLEAARAALASMNRAWEIMDTALTAYVKAADSIRDGREWISPSYLEYDFQCTETVKYVKARVAQLAELKEILGKEIAEWESAASKLG